MVWSLWRHRRSIVTSSAECKAGEWDTGMMCEDRCFSVIFGFVMSCKNKIMYVLLWRTVHALTRVLFWSFCPSLLHNSGNKHQNNPLVSALTVRHAITYIILYVFLVNRGPNGPFNATRTYPYIFSGLWHINLSTAIFNPWRCRMQHGDTSTESVDKEIWSQIITPLECDGLPNNTMLIKPWLVMTHWHIPNHLDEKDSWH